MCRKKQDLSTLEFYDQCKDGVLELVKDTLEKSSDQKFLLSSTDDDNKQPLHFIGYYGHDDVMEYLIPFYRQFGLTIDPVDNLGFTPLLYCCYRGYDQSPDDAEQTRINCVRLLVENGANPNYVKERTFLTPLHWAGFNDDPQVVLYLLIKGAEQNFSDTDETPIDVAGLCQNYNCVKVMLSFWIKRQKKLDQGRQTFTGDQSSEKMLPAAKPVGLGQIQPMTGSNAQGTTVVLKYDTKQNSSGFEQKVFFRHMFWAAFLGRNDLITYSITHGYSPFIRGYRKKSAVMGAVENKQLDTVRLIFYYNYISKDQQAFERSKSHQDYMGNNALHLANKVSNKPIADFLEKTLDSVKDKRNFRGLVPIQMNHKVADQIEEAEIEAEPDYCFVVKKQRAAFLISQLRDLKLGIKEFPSALNSKHTLLIVYFSDELLDQVGEVYNMEVRILDHGQTLPFKTYADDIYEQFNARQKQFLMMKVFEQEIDIEYFKKVHVIVDHFPLHDEFKNKIATSWNQNRTGLFFGFISGDYFAHMQPINFIASYYGEKAGFYFAWLVFYTSWLLIPGIPGLALFIYQMYKIAGQKSNKEAMNIDNEWNCLFCIVLAIWSTVMVEVWKRRECEIAHSWNMTNYQGNDGERPEYVADMAIDVRLRSSVKINIINSYLRKVQGEIPTILTGVTIVAVAFWGYFKESNDNKDDESIGLGATIIYSLGITILGGIYKYIAVVLANWENHKFKEDWENSLISKSFAFLFVNAYISLISKAFALRSFNDVAILLITLLAAKQVLLNVSDVLVPKIQLKLKQRKLQQAFMKDFPGKSENAKEQKLHFEMESQTILQQSSGILVSKYSDLAIQFGSIVFFAQAFPLAPLVSILSNFIEMKAQMNMLAFYSKRFPAEGASGIGTWKQITEMLSMVSIGVNCAVIYWTSQTLPQILDYQYDALSSFMIIVLIEHIMIGTKIVLAIIIPDKPTWVVKEEREQQDQMEQLFNLLDSKEKEFRDGGGVTINDQILQLREEKQKFIQPDKPVVFKSNEEAKDDIDEDLDLQILVLKSEKALKRGKITLQELFEVNEKAFKLKAGIMADDIQKKINLRDLKKTLILQNVSQGVGRPSIAAGVAATNGRQGLAKDNQTSGEGREGWSVAGFDPM